MNQITNFHQNQNKVVVSMGYDNIETNITLTQGHGATLPDPSISGSYDLIWWNASDYISPTNDPSAEVVRCIAKIGDTLVIIRSQQQTLASPKNISGKSYNMTPFPYNNLETLSYYNIPQSHGIGSHTGNIGTEANITFATTGGHSHTGTDSTKISISATDKILGRATAGTGAVEEITCTAAGRSLLANVDAAAQRTTLGLGSLATQSGTFSGTSSGTNTGDNAANSSTLYLGTTAIALNRTSGALALTGITSIDGSSTSCTGTAANANTLGGASSSDAAVNSTIVKRTVSGYIVANYINTTADVTGTTPTHFAIQTGPDSYIRWQTLANVKTALGLSSAGNMSVIRSITPTFSGDWTITPSPATNMFNPPYTNFTTTGYQNYNSPGNTTHTGKCIFDLGTEYWVYDVFCWIYASCNRSYSTNGGGITLFLAPATGVYVSEKAWYISGTGNTVWNELYRRPTTTLPTKVRYIKFEIYCYNGAGGTSQSTQTTWNGTYVNLIVMP